MGVAQGVAKLKDLRCGDCKEVQVSVDEVLVQRALSDSEESGAGRSDASLRFEDIPELEDPWLTEEGTRSLEVEGDGGALPWMPSVALSEKAREEKDRQRKELTTKFAKLKALYEEDERPRPKTSGAKGGTAPKDDVLAGLGPLKTVSPNSPKEAKTAGAKSKGNAGPPGPGRSPAAKAAVAGGGGAGQAGPNQQPLLPTIEEPQQAQEPPREQQDTPARHEPLISQPLEPQEPALFEDMDDESGHRCMYDAPSQRAHS